VGRLHWARVRHKGGRGEGGMQRRTTGGGGIGSASAPWLGLGWVVPPASASLVSWCDSVCVCVCVRALAFSLAPK